MFIRHNEFEGAYRNIRKHALTSPGVETVLIFVANDIDAMCACHMLVSLLKVDWIAHKIIPVASYTEISEKCSIVIDGNEDLKSIILINCGGVVNLSDILTLNPHHLVYVFESQRPLNLNNLFANQQVYVFDDGYIDTELKEVRNAFEMIEFHDFDENEDEDESESPLQSHAEDAKEDEVVEVQDTLGEYRDASSDLGHPHATLTPPRISPSFTSPFSAVAPPVSFSPKPRVTSSTTPVTQGTSSTPLSSPSSTPSAPRHTPAPPPSTPPLHPSSTSPLPSTPINSSTAHRKRKLSTSSTISFSSSSVVGPKRQRHTYGHILYEHYTQGTWTGTSVAYLLLILLEQLGRNNLDHVWLAILGLTEQRCYQKISEKKYLDMVRYYQGYLQRLNTPEDFISKITEPNLIMHRHWTFFMAMKHCPLIACKLGTWSEKGLSKLRLLLAKMGIPKEEYEKPFVHMDKTIKDEVIKELFTHAPTFGLDVLAWSTFLKPSVAYGSITASDAVHALTALSVTSKTSSFYTMYDTLLRLEDQLGLGLKTAKTLKQSMLVLMASLIARQSVKSLTSMRYVLMRDGYDPQLLAHPVCLRELSLFLLGALRELQTASPLPLILCMLLPNQPTFLVYGCLPPSSTQQPNMLGLLFQEAATKVKAEHRHDGFDNAFIEISVADIMDFLEQLQIMLAQRKLLIKSVR